MIVFFEGFKVIHFNGTYDKALYEHGKHSELRALIQTEPTHVMTTSVSFASSKIRESIALSDVIIFRHFPSNDAISFNESIFLGLLRVNSYELFLYLFPSSFFELMELSKHYFTNEPIVLLDLDKTLIICDADVMKGRDHFLSHIIIESKSVNDNLPFQHHVMIRSDAHVFLERLFKLTSKVYIITAADLYYAESIINGANDIGWLSNFHFPMSNIYSTRNTPMNSLLKRFTMVVPLSFLTGSQVLIAVDDNIHAWEPALHKNVLQVKPFETDEISGELVKIIEIIENEFYQLFPWNTKMNISETELSESIQN